MKRILLTALLAFCLTPLLAQNNSFYQKYSKTEGITKVYISRSLLSLFGNSSSVDVGTDRVDISQVASKLSGIYVLSTERPDVAQAMKKDFDRLLKDGNFELLMEVDDAQDHCVIYLSRDGKFVRDLYLCARDDNEFSIIQITGEMTQEDLNRIVKMGQED